MEDTRRHKRIRESMVENQIEARGVHDPRVLSAMLSVPRHLFVNEALIDQAYSDHPLPIGDQQTISQPYIVARMTEALDLKKGGRVLEIGTGSGYQAAILAQTAFRVYTIERNRRLYSNARALFDKFGYYNIVTRYGDGTMGWKEESPFDAIIVTAGAPVIPDTLVDQLDIGGRMVIPVGSLLSQELVLIEKTEDGVTKSNLGGCRFVKLIGQHGWRTE